MPSRTMHPSRTQLSMPPATPAKHENRLTRGSVFHVTWCESSGPSAGRHQQSRLEPPVHGMAGIAECRGGKPGAVDGRGEVPQPRLPEASSPRMRPGERPDRLRHPVARARHCGQPPRALKCPDPSARRRKWNPATPCLLRAVPRRLPACRRRLQ